MSSDGQERRFIIIGAGAVGGALAAQLAPAGHDVVVVARGEHGRRIAENGLVVRRPGGVETVRLNVVSGPQDITLRVSDVLIFAIKTQDAECALEEWAWQPVTNDAGAEPDAPVLSSSDLPIVTFQNGLATEPLALRRFRRVYGATIAIAASYLTPGEIVSPSPAPAVGMIWIGRYGQPRDPWQDAVADFFTAAGLVTFSVDDVRESKGAKLLGNVGNALDLLEGSVEDTARARQLLRAEATEVLRAAQWPLPTGDALDYGGVKFRVDPVEGHVPGKSSTWQSFERSVSSEVDYLNGEIVLQARLHGLRAPSNERLQWLAGRASVVGSDDRPTVTELLDAASLVGR